MSAASLASPAFLPARRAHRGRKARFEVDHSYHVDALLEDAAGPPLLQFRANPFKQGTMRPPLSS